MRKSTVIMVVIMLLACLGMLFMANAVLTPIQEDITSARELQRWLEDRGDLAPGSLVKMRRIPKDPAREGLGLMIELTPAPELLKRPRALTALVRRAAEHALADYPLEGGGTPRWVGLRVSLPEGVERACDLLRAPGGGLLDPAPPLPDVWPPPAPPTVARPPAPVGPAAGPEAPPAGPGAPR